MASGAIKYRPFKFERSFDTESVSTQRRKEKEAEEQKRLEEEAAQEELPPPPPTFSEEELQAAKEAAYEEGYAAGHEQAKQEQENHVIAALHTITGQLAVLHDRQTLANEVTSSELARITGDIIARLLPHYAGRHGPDEIVSLVKTCLEPLEDTGRVTVKVSPDLRDAMEERLENAKVEAGFLGQLVILPDPSLGPADVRVDWGQGGAARNTESTWQMIDEAISHASDHGQKQAKALEQASATPEPEPAIPEKDLEPGEPGTAAEGNTPEQPPEGSQPSTPEQE